tara:strand:- start:2409 stop:2588 length:180 start_codon:yes stop_codon:yes gene_type:complete
MRNLSALVIASFITATPLAQAEDGSDRYNQMLERVSSQTEKADGNQQQHVATQQEQTSS